MFCGGYFFSKLKKKLAVLINYLTTIFIQVTVLIFLKVAVCLFPMDFVWVPQTEPHAVYGTI